jgi:hypothetical protein
MIRGIVLILALCVNGFAADSAQDVKDFFRKAEDALASRKAASLWLLFDPAMPGYKQLRANSDALLHDAEVEATLGIVKDEGDERSRSVELDWRMEIVQEEGHTSATHRKADVKCRLERRDGAWRIVAFAPLDVFAPVHAGDAWDDLVAAVSLLSRPADDSPANPASFLRSVDPAMPGFEKLRAGITGLVRRGDVESTLDLISNEGDDRVRTLEVDWLLQVSDDATGIGGIRKEKHIQVRMTLQGKHWRIASLDPLDFFSL